MKKARILVLFFIGSIFTIYAQENESNNFTSNIQNQQINLSFGGWSGTTLHMGNINWSSGSWKTSIKNNQIRNALLMYPDSAQEYYSFSRNRKIFNGWYWGGLTVMLAAPFVPLPLLYCLC